MKLSWKQIEPFVKNPDPKARVVLVYGPDDGLMRERARAIGLSVVSDYADPFNVAALSSDILQADPARLSDEAGAISMMGGDRLIRIEDAADKITPLIKDYLENPSQNTLVVLEAGDLSPRSSLRKLCESARNAAALPCYVEDERGLARLIREHLQAENLAAEPDAVTWLAANIGGDRGKVRAELEKLIVYAGRDAARITLEDARAVCGQGGAQGVDDLVNAVAGHESAAALKIHGQLLAEGVNFIVALRALQNHFRRLHLARSLMDRDGMPPGEAVKSLRPPVFFKHAPAFESQLGRWPASALMRALERLAALEAQCKTTGAPADTLCAQAVLSLSAARN